ALHRRAFTNDVSHSRRLLALLTQPPDLALQLTTLCRTSQRMVKVNRLNGLLNEVEGPRPEGRDGCIHVAKGSDDDDGNVRSRTYHALAEFNSPYATE